ncbi:ATP-binding protein [Dactylosporangium sp. NPDC000555]|uniref:ATP-binding protein n=1 Tax=Dactylosporangium sp. NPDC000555 TaxID=3154260 RepID=UPI00331F8C75
MTTTVAEPRAWCVVVPHHPRGAHVARHRLADELDALIPADRLDDAIAIAAELVGNAVRHAAPLPGDVIRMAWRLLPDDTLEIRVTDGGSAAGPQLRVAAPDALDGRGLTIVAALATGWGVERDGLGQCVWATL